MPDDVLLNKVAIIERCIARVRAEHNGDDANIVTVITRQDSIVLNLQRACEAAIDLAMHLVRVHTLGIPQDSRDAFRLLTEAGLLDLELSESMQRMVGFRNVAIHDYRALNLDVVRNIVHHRLDEFLALATWGIQHA